VKDREIRGNGKMGKWGNGKAIGYKEQCKMKGKK
jgi:hypothetical protein